VVGAWGTFVVVIIAGGEELDGSRVRRGLAGFRRFGVVAAVPVVVVVVAVTGWIVGDAGGGGELLSMMPV
jgi:hypothetical protein